MHTKLGVVCGGPSKPLPDGVKLASDGTCPHCGEKHGKSPVAPTSSGTSSGSIQSDSERPRPAA
jgi:hypothetical protein